jgi:hypothetical protein
MDTLAMTERFKQRAKAVRKRNMPPIAGAERVAFIKQAELDYQDFAIVADAEISLDGGILTIDLRPAICDATIRGEGHLETETKVAMKTIASAGPLDYLKHLPTELPTDGNKITPGMLDSKADLKDLIDGAEMFRVVETIEPIGVKALPGDHMPMPPLVV